MKLRECPFCGGEAQNRDRGIYSFIKCKSCGVLSPSYQTLEGAARFWNTRAIRSSPSPEGVERLIDHIKTLELAVIAMRDLINSSGGVVGLHLNGDMAPWGELEEGGRFEDWLINFNQAEKAMNERKLASVGGSDDLGR